MTIDAIRLYQAADQIGQLDDTLQKRTIPKDSATGVADSMGGINRVNGYGAGVRWRSPLGPINFDVAYGDAEHKVRLHFSVGYAF